MRLLLLGAPGPYPERLERFVQDGHHLWHVSTLALAPAEHIAGVPTVTSWELSPVWEETPARLVRFIEDKRIDIVCSLLNVWDNSNAVTAALLRHGCPVPLVRHYKEHYLAPSEDERTCIEDSQGAIFINAESRDYFNGVYRLPKRTLVADADLIPRRYLEGALQPKLSQADGRPHLLIAGTVTADSGRYDYRALIGELIARGCHIHLFGHFRRLHPSGQMRHAPEVEELYRAVGQASGAASGKANDERLHFHYSIPPARFVEEWSPFDAGLLHMPAPDDVFRAHNLPNRYSAYLAAGLAVALPAGEMPAMQRHLEATGAAIVYRDAADLVSRLPDRIACAAALRARHNATFEAVYPSLVDFIQACRQS